MKKLNKTLTCKYAVIRRDDMTIIAEMDFFPDCNRSLMHLSREEHRCLMNRAIVLTVIKLARCGLITPATIKG
ncbi:hypothetical protein DOH34_25510 [Salmonella enterica subsp. enterica serovar Wangata]|nr:hypothetical protein [Salmonella enterica subsp. enterica serovar Wangata]